MRNAKRTFRSFPIVFLLFVLALSFLGSIPQFSNNLLLKSFASGPVLNASVFKTCTTFGSCPGGTPNPGTSALPVSHVGDYVIVSENTYQTATAPTISDSFGDSFTLLEVASCLFASCASGSNFDAISQLWYAVSLSSGTDTITLTGSVTSYSSYDLTIGSNPVITGQTTGANQEQLCNTHCNQGAFSATAAFVVGNWGVANYVTLPTSCTMSAHYGLSSVPSGAPCTLYAGTGFWISPQFNGTFSPASDKATLNVGGSTDANFVGVVGVFALGPPIVRVRFVPPVAGTFPQRPNFFYTFQGTAHTLVVQQTFQTVMVDNNTSWTTTNPFYYNLLPYSPSPSGGTITGNQNITITYPSVGSQCFAGFHGDSVQDMQNGQWLCASLVTYGDLIGIPWVIGLVLFDIIGMIYLKSGNAGLTLLILVISFGIFGVGGNALVSASSGANFLPGPFQLIGLGATAVGITGIIWKLYAGRRAQ